MQSDMACPACGFPQSQHTGSGCPSFMQLSFERR